MDKKLQMGNEVRLERISLAVGLGNPKRGQLRES